MFNKIYNAFKFNDTALDLISYRQAILASNITNSNTPNYQSKDINFSKELKKSMIKNINFKRLPLINTSWKHINHSNESYISKIKVFNTNSKNQSSIHNSVNMNIERVKFINNSIQYQTVLTLLNNQIKNMFNVIQG
ncbi:Flagellar basal body rod protein FlgB [Buchnera aphidicola (Eriosoma lanigerum)]|uniref:flagellar basal body rod protein FlgB n=1 Tax=Buchnera aphidicola TaxID=9 RepID=UPI0034646EF1